jgi:hypothetical protein
MLYSRLGKNKQAGAGISIFIGLGWEVWQNIHCYNTTIIANDALKKR